MKLDYTRIDSELLPGVEAFPALEITRDNVAQLRALMKESAGSRPAADQCRIESY